MEISNILNLIAGLGFFLYGMKVMGDGLEKTAGDRMSQIIDNVTGNLFKGVLVGTVVTAIIQSSSATTVMVVGFINAGIMTLKQSVGVIMGANIGTCITAMLISLESVNSSSMALLNIVKPSNLAPIAMIVGAVMLMFFKKKKVNNVGEIFAGFGILFTGMNLMSGSMECLEKIDMFKTFMQTLSNPILGVLFGLILTLIIQSSSATVGMLQAASVSGAIAFPSAAAIVLGCNIGACTTAVISSFGTKKDAKRAALMNVLLKVSGMCIFVVALYVFGVGKLFSVWECEANRFNIAAFHTLFNVINTIIMLPLSKVLIGAVNKLIPDADEDEVSNPLEERLLATPSLALAQTTRELNKMMTVAAKSVRYGYEMLNGKRSISMEKLEKVENSIDLAESRITQYLVKLSDQPVNVDENAIISATFHVITDIERIGDHAFNISEIANDVLSNGIKFSAAAQKELNNMYKAVTDMIDTTLKAYETSDAALAATIQPLEDVIDYFQEHLKETHLERLAKHECTFNAGVAFLDIVNNLERIGDHCSNIGLAVEQFKSDNIEGFDPHAYLDQLHANKPDEYMRIYSDYIEKYTK